MADDTRSKIEKENAEAFKRTISSFRESVIRADLANQELDKGGVALQEFKNVWKDEVSTPMKNMVGSFTSVIPGFGLASKLSLLVWKNTLGENRRRKKREKEEEKLLRERLGLSKKQMKDAREAAQKVQAEEALLKNLIEVSEGFGLLTDFNLDKEIEKKDELQRLENWLSAAETGRGDALSTEQVERMKQLQEEQKNLNQTELNILEQQEKILYLKDKQADIGAKGAERSDQSVEWPEIRDDFLDAFKKDDNGEGESTSKALTVIAEQQKLATTAMVALSDAGTTAGSIHMAWDDGSKKLEDIADVGKEGGSAAKEQANEQRRKDERLIGTLEGIEKNTEELDGIKKKTDKEGKGFLSKLLGGGGLFAGAKTALADMGGKFFPGGAAGMKAVAPKALGFLKAAGPAALVVGGVVAVAAMAKDGIEGYNKAAKGEWGNVDKISGAIGSALGGTGAGGGKQAFMQAMKMGTAGAAAGMMIGGPVGALVGGIVGAAAGGVAGFIGGEKIANWVDGAVTEVRNVFNLPELLTEEQKKNADARLVEIKKEAETFETQIATLEKQLASGVLTGKARIEAMDKVEALRASQNKLIDEEDALRNKLSGSILAEKQNQVDAASEEYQQALKTARQEKSKLIWIGLTHGKDSEEYQTQLDRYNAAATWATNSKTKLGEQKTAYDAAQKEHDLTHETMMGNVRLFWSDFKDSIPSWSDVKTGVTAFLKDPKGTITTALKDWDLTLPSWTDIKTGLAGTAAFKFLDNATDMVTGQLRDWGVPVPTWDEVKTKLATVSAGAFNLLDKGAGAVTDKLQDYGVPIPDWKDVKAGVTGFLADPKGTLQGVLNKYDIKLPTWDSVVDGVTGFLNDPKAGLTTAFNTLSANMPDFVSGAGDWAADKMSAWKTALPEIKLPDLSEAMAGISDMASAAKNKVTGFFKGLFGAGDSEIETRTQEEITKHGQTLKAAKKSGLYDANWSGDSTINREALQQGVESKMIQKDMLDAIIADEDISKEDLEFMKKLVEQATTAGSLFVHDIGIHDRLDSILSNDFAKASFRAAVVGQSSSAGSSSSQNIIVNAPSSNQVANTKMEASIGISDPFTQAARAY